MNDDIRSERLYGDALHSLAPNRAPDRLRTNIHREVAGASPRPRWLALIKEPPMRTNSRLAVGSPTWRVAAIMAATILVATLVVGASFAGSQILVAQDGIIVDADGAGTHTSIAAAVADAAEGDAILVRPGTYEEAFVLDKTLAIRGDGPVDDIVVTAPAGGPTTTSIGTWTDPYSIHVAGGDGTVEGLTFRGERAVVAVSSGSPTLRGLVFDGVGRPRATEGLVFDGNAIIVTGVRATPTIEGVTLRGGGPIGVFDAGSPTVTDNTLLGGAELFLSGSGAGTVISDNVIDGSRVAGLHYHGHRPVTISDNVFRDTGEMAIWLGGSASATVSGNVIEGGPTSVYGIGVDGALAVDLINNRISGTDFAVAWKGGSGRLKANAVSDNSSGVVISGGSPIVEHNSVCDNAAANVAVVEPATPDIRNNAFCEEPSAG